MAIVSMCGFDRPETLGAVVRTGTPIPAFVSPRTGAPGRAVRLDNSTTTLELRHPIAQPTTAVWVHIGFWLKVITGGSTQSILLVLPPSGGTSGLGGIGLAVGGQLTALRNGSLVAATGTINAGDGGWHHVQVSILSTSATSGRIKVWVDGVLDINFTGTTVSSSGNTGTQGVAFSLSTASRTIDIDDAWIDFDNTEWTAAKALTIATISPNGAGASTAWTPTPSTTPNWQAAGDSVDDTYVSSQTVGARDLYTFADLPAGATSVEAVSLYTRGQQVGAGAPLVKPLHRHSNGTVTVGAGIAQGASMGNNVPQTWTVNPATGLAWTVADVNAAQFGIELSS